MSVRKTGGGAAIGASDMAGHQGTAAGGATEVSGGSSSKTAPVAEGH